MQGSKIMTTLRHVGIVVRDMSKSLKLYRDIFNLEVVWDEIESGLFIDKLLRIPNVKVRTVKLKDKNGGVIELLEYLSLPQEMHPTKINDIGCSHIAITVDNCNETFKKLRNEGLKFNYIPQVSADGKVKVAFCKDYDEVSIEIVEEMK